MFVLFDYFKYLYVQDCIKIPHVLRGVEKSFRSPDFDLLQDSFQKPQEVILCLRAAEMLLPDSGKGAEKVQYL